MAASGGPDNSVRTLCHAPLEATILGIPRLGTSGQDEFRDHGRCSGSRPSPPDRDVSAMLRAHENQRYDPRRRPRGRLRIQGQWIQAMTTMSATRAASNNAPYAG